MKWYFWQLIMSNISEYIQNNPHESHRLLGLKYEQLQQLLEKAIKLHHQKQQLVESKKTRIIQGGGG
ncbi:DDE transposase family protein, partial [Cylindrospermopsis raciborskii CS-506_B]|nr:DDE transposase family protein [Cylindrospermopsis raciborskii CS-506_B]